MVSEEGREIILLGAAGRWAAEAAEIAEDGGWLVRGLVNNLRPEEVRPSDCPFPIYQLDQLPAALRGLPALCVLLTPAYRRLLVEQAAACGITNFVRLIHPSAQVFRSASLGAGAYVGPLARLGRHAEVGCHTFVCSGVFVGHDAHVDDFVTLTPGASVGSLCRVQEGAYVGPGAILLPEVRVGRNAVVAAGAVVTEHVPDHCLVAGLPAIVKKTGIPGYRAG